MTTPTEELEVTDQTSVRPIDTVEYWRDLAEHRSKSIEQLLARIQHLEIMAAQVIDHRERLAAALARHYGTDTQTHAIGDALAWGTALVSCA